MDLSSSPLNAYLWREHPNLMRVSLVILGLLALNAVVTLAEHYGLSPPPPPNTPSLSWASRS